MKVGETRPFVPSRPAERVGRTGGARPVHSTETVQSVNGDEHAADLLGIPQEEFTPKVRSAIMTLLNEVEQLRDEVSNATRRLEELEKVADLDTLTPVANRRAFVRDLSRTISYAQRYNIEASLLYFDVNDLKRINDEFGHAAGDAALVQIANVLATHVRESDVVARLGGDEFAVLLVQANENQAMIKGAELSKIIADTPIDYEGNIVHTHVAYGAYTFKPGEKPHDILDQADKRMYAHKRNLKEKGSA